MTRQHVSREDILRFLTATPKPVTKRELAQAFNITGDDRIILKDLLRDLEREGVIVKQPGQEYAIPQALPTVGVIEIIDSDIDGELFARPTEWDAVLQGPVPKIEIMPDAGKAVALAPGNRALATLKRISDKYYEAQIIRRLDSPQGRVLGLLARTNRGFILKPTQKGARYDYDVHQGDTGGASEGDLCLAELQHARGVKNKRVRVIQVIGRQDDPRAISLVAMHESGIKPDFPKAVIDETADMAVPDLKGREDLRSIPLVTIDGADARDFDDAVFAEMTADGEWHLIVAIADVAYYVTPFNALNKEAFRRGNSTYFPDRVVPMLPERLSNDLCSLRPHENRACLAVHMWVGMDGRMKRHKFVRGIMRSVARLTYEQTQAARDGLRDEVTGPLMDSVINPLYSAYEILWKAREERGALELDLPERKIIVNDKNIMTGVTLRQRLDSHKLIEEFMILANVAAAEALEARSAPCLYRVHERPDPDKLDSAREFVEGFGLSLPKGQVLRPAQINQVLKQAASLPYSHVISQVILRSQAQARYDPDNMGHFGLALRRYAHFTSPIRRYADLIVHRSLIRAYNLGPSGLSDEEAVRMEEIAEHISETERQSMEAERSAVDRFTAAYMADRTGAQFTGRISGVTHFGLFVTLAESGADGIVPIRTLPDDFYDHDEKQHALIGRRTGRLYRLGATVTVRLVEALPLTGGIVLAMANDDSADIPGLKMPPPQGRRTKPHREKRSWKKSQEQRRGGPPHRGGKGPSGGKKRRKGR